eukprot:g5161.t1
MARMRSFFALLLLFLPTATATTTPNHTLGHLPFSWATLPRYTFCVNSSGPLSEASLDYISKQPIYLNNPVLARKPGEVVIGEQRIPAQAKALRAKNPAQQQWFYYAIDLIRPHNFENDHYVLDNADECQLKDKNGKPVERYVWDFSGGPGSCGFDRWLNTSRAMITEGGLDGIFIDGFQGCDPFNLPNGCQRVCKSAAGCDPETMKKWNAGLRLAMWTLKKEILGENGTMICNSTPGPYTCGNAKKPVEDCPCDGTNDERGGGSWDHMQYVANIDDTDGDYAMLTHVPHANDKAAIMPSIARFMMAVTKYQYHGSGFGYECDGSGWLSTDPDVEHAFSAPLGEPLGPANETAGCAPEPKCCAKNATCSPGCHQAGAFCARTRRFASGTKAYANYTSGATCVSWSDGQNYTTKGRHGDDGCAQAAGFEGF